MPSSAYRIHLGFEIGTGDAVGIPLHHAVLTGLTRLSGKTTAAEAIMGRLPEGFKALAFRTKRGEIAFRAANPVVPFFRARTDWEYVQSLLEAAMKERMKFERSWIIKAVKGTTTLREVYSNIKGELESGKRLRGLDESVWTNLAAYFEKILPQLEAHPFADSLELHSGPNLMDLGHLSEEVQALVIASSLEQIWQEGKDTLVVIPEAWRFVPQQRGNPVKWAAQHVIREGGAVGVYLLLDSQDIAGVEKAVLKSCDIWLLGRQREWNEVVRVLKQLPTRERPRPDEVMKLALGHFFVAAGDWCRQVYVQPTWLDSEAAVEVALGRREVPAAPEMEEEDPMVIADLEGKLKAVEEERDQLKAQVATLNQEIESNLRQVREYASNLEALELRLAGVQKGVEMLHRGFELLGVFPGGATVDIDRIVAEAVKRMPTGQSYILEAKEFILKDYQQREVSRILEAVSGLTAEQKDLLRFLAGVGKVERREAARAVFAQSPSSFSNRAWGDKWNKERLLPVVDIGAAIWDSKHGMIIYSLPETVKRQLEVYRPTPQEVEQVVAAAETMFAKGKVE